MSERPSERSSAVDEGAERGTSEPLLRVVRGEPTDVELAALVAVVAARASGEAAEPPAPRSRWAAPRPRPELRHGPGAWTGSALPR
jgi:hypothetical protein